MKNTSELIDTLSLSYWALQTVAMLVTCALIPKLKITSIFGAITTVIALAFVNSTLWSAALFLQVPNSLTTQTLSLFIANGIIFWILVKILPGIEVEGFLPALIAPVVFTICSLAIDQFHDRIPWNSLYTKGLTLIQESKEFFEKSTHTLPIQSPSK